ncbi:MAG TPA: insulinase family protein [Myxococcales bacterium]|nr:insulinase family protein [Myxococcales bacterium]
MRTSRIATLALAALLACGHAQQASTTPPAASATSSARRDATPAQRTETAEAKSVETPDAPFRAEKPEALRRPLRFDAPVPVERKLRNGARVLVTELHAVPLVSIDVVFGTGINGEPVEKAGLAGFVSRMLTEGTTTRTTTQLAAELDDRAIELSAGAGNETSRVRMNTLREALPKAVELLADVMQNPAFHPDDVERVRTLKLAALAQKQGNPGAIAADQAAKLLYGEKHPWGQPAGGTPDTVKATTISDLRKFHDSWYRPNNALISVAGDVTADEIVGLLEQRLGGWKKGNLPKLRLPPFPALRSRIIDAIDKPATTQSQVWVVGRLFDARSPDRIPMFVANEVLGGLFTSRLNMNLREKHGYSYGVFSSVYLSRTYGTFTAAGGILANHTVEAVNEFEVELDRFVSGGPTDDELVKAKETIIRSLPGALETNDAVASALATIAFNGLPLDYYRTVPDRVAQVTRADAARVAKKWIEPARWPVIIVGPVGSALDDLQALALGPVRLDTEPGVREVRAGPRQAPATAKGPTAGSVAIPSESTQPDSPSSPSRGAQSPAATPSTPQQPAAPGASPARPGTPPAAAPGATQPAANPRDTQSPPPSDRQ